MKGPKYLTDLRGIPHISEEEHRRLREVTDKFPFRSNEYYLSLINWDDPEDPIRKIAIPDPAELEEWGTLDASGESTYVVAPGVEHKYGQTALVLLTNRCAGYCRYCFRKRLFMQMNTEIVRDLTQGIEYIRNHPEITNVLLSGGDPLFLSTRRLEIIIREIRGIDHVRIIRIGSRMPVTNPYRIIGDPSLPEMIRRYSTPAQRVYVVTHFVHPRELTDAAIEGLDLLQGAGAILANQTPLLRGINDDPIILGELLRTLSFAGVAPYYIFQCRPTLGNRHFAVPVEEGYRIFEQAKSRCSGLAKRPVFAMSHRTGKIRIVGLDDECIYFKYHQAARREDIGKFMVFSRNPEAMWFDDYTVLLRESRVPAAKPAVR